MTVVSQQTPVTPPALPALDLLSLEDIQQYVNMLIIGPYGVGKTHLVSGIALDKRIQRVLFVDFEKGTRTLKYVKERVPEKLDIVRVPGVNPDTGKARTFSQSIEVVRRHVEANRYDVVVLDPLNGAVETFFTELMRPMVNEALKGGYPPPPPRQQDYRTCADAIRRMVRELKDQPCHLIAVCLEKRSTDEVTKEVSRQPDLFTSLATGIPALFDAVLWMDMKLYQSKPAERYLVCQPTSERFGRSRGSDLPREVADPTMTKLFDLLGF